MNFHQIPLYRAAHSKTGDKGNRSNISVIAYRPELFPLILEQLSEQAVARHFSHRNPKSVTRYVLDRLAAINFVLDEVLDGGVNGALNLDSHGKALSYWLLDFQVSVPEKLLHCLHPEQALLNLTKPKI